MPLLRVPPAFVRREIQTLLRTFPNCTVVITRAVDPVVWNDVGDAVPSTQIVYNGEALVIPAGGTVSAPGLGQIELKHPRLLISGAWPIEQGDEVALDGRQYTVEHQPDPWHAFVLVTLQPANAASG